MSSSYPSIIGALKDSLGKPDLHPRAREVLEERLQHHLDRSRRNRREGSRNSLRLRRAWENSAKVRSAQGEKKRREVLPLILKLREEGRTYKEIKVILRTAGVTSTRGTPYSNLTLGTMVRNNSRRLADSGQAPRPAGA